MCLIALKFAPGQPRFLLLAANRDEEHARPARPMAWWGGGRDVLAGRDERAGGTWMATGRSGRWAAVTNLRNGAPVAGRRSRGDLPTGFVDGGLSPEDYVRRVWGGRADYGPFNLLAGTAESLWYCSSVMAPQNVPPGVHALSNGRLDEPWPKSRRVATALRGLSSGAAVDCERLFGLMDDRQTAPDEELPDTGVGLELERLLSPPFIVGEHYGTRCTTILSLHSRGRSLAAERSFDAAGGPVGEVHYGFGPT